jgi:hypothetical protein
LENNGGKKGNGFQLWHLIVGVYVFLILAKCTDGGGSDSESDCHVEWDGRANPTVCE